MNTTINNVNNLSFSARYLRIQNEENFPVKLLDSIYKSDAVDEFIKAGKPKTIWENFVNIFKKNEYLDVIHEVSKIKFPVDYPIADRLRDPYQKVESLIFKFNKNGKERRFEVSAEQRGIKRKQGSIPKQGEDFAYRPPLMRAEDELVKKVEELKDINSLLR